MSQPGTLIHAVTVLARKTGKSLNSDRDWLNRQVNRIRRAAWKVDSLRLLHFRDSGCECVECFTSECPTGCSAGKFVGITLPQNVTSVSYLRARGLTVDMTAMRLPDSGCCASPCGCLKAEILVRKAPLQREIPANYKGQVVFVAKDDKDKNKRIGVEYVIRDTNRIQREDLVIANTTGIVTKWSPLYFTKITFPERCGWIEVRTVEGYSLGAYHPAILSPSHVKIRMHGVGAGDLVEWEGLKEPHDVRFETDQVEWSSDVDWENHYTFLDLHFKTGRSPAEERAYQAAAAFARSGADSELKATLPTPIGTLKPRGLTTLRRRIFGIQR